MFFPSLPDQLSHCATRVKELLQRGVNVCAASDNVHDPFNPFGSYDLLHIAHLSAHVSHLTGLDELQAALAMVTLHPARLMQEQNVYNETDTNADIAPGAAADLVILDTHHVKDCGRILPGTARGMGEGSVKEWSPPILVSVTYLTRVVSLPNLEMLDECDVEGVVATAHGAHGGNPHC